ncbi:ankyrin repeat domain-containing protein 39 isoform X1 [Heterocephalus glaber]|uniref:Ankyrin repeat domain-containing protein 39 isoform X1 n=1 Tax=Heterocephalus glaber TaxID=10181 RepID=A0AAX6SV65_HETGA|nr:ankyrin repeat domain-containing protein 39 isoform X1 [Heterocephalus glaber]
MARPALGPHLMQSLFAITAEQRACACPLPHFSCVILQGIWSAALDGDLARVKSFIQKAMDPSQPDSAGYTALHYASRNGHYAVCQFLLESGAKCDAQTHGGATALHRASYCGHTEIARLLLSHGSDPQLVDDDGMTSLHKSAVKVRATAIASLSVLTRDTHMVSSPGEQRIHWENGLPSHPNCLLVGIYKRAAERGHGDICSLLLQHSPALKAIRDRKARLACDLLPDNTTLRDLLTS